jgi:hypothetical protein
MTPQESRDQFLGGILNEEECEHLRDIGAYEDYIEGAISINDIYTRLRDQGE